MSEVKRAKKIVKRTREQVIKRWVKALRAGKYEQTTGDLKNDEGFCCLGVLCDLAAKDGGSTWTNDCGGGFSYKDKSGILSDDMRKFVFGRKSALHNKLIDLNDNGSTFKEIADIIEQKLL